MDLLHDWFEIIANGGWNGAIVAAATIIGAMFVLSFISNKYVWALILLAVAVYLIATYATGA